jgi:hypothetical protein
VGHAVASVEPAGNQDLLTWKIKLMIDYKKEFEKAVTLLSKLNALKVIKDSLGKNDYYVKTQPKVWQEVREYLSTVDHLED